MTKFTKFAVAALAFAFLFVGAKSFATISVPPNLMVNSKGQEVMDLQAQLNAAGAMPVLTVDGSFGPMTKTAVMWYQGGHGLTADGVVGPMTAASLNGVTTGTLPAGCTSTSGYSSTTGVACNSGSGSMPAGCLPGYMFSPTTGAACTTTGGGSTSSGALEGGAGDLDLTSTSTDVEDKVKEGEEDVKIFGVKGEADGSDVEITSMKITFQNEGYASSSENFEKYVDSVSIWMDDEEVGSADADDFTKDSGTPDEFSKTISLDGAIVRDDEEAKFYVAVSAVSTIDSEDIDFGDWAITLDTVRFTDATGAILTADSSDFDTVGDNDNFSFEDASSDDQVELKSSTENPDDMTVQVEEDSTSDDYTSLVYKLDVDDDSGDVMVTSTTVTIDVTNYDVNDSGTVTSTDDSTSDSAIENILDSVTFSIDGEEFDADLDEGSVSINNGTGTATYTVDFDDDDFTIDAGDDASVEVMLTFNDQDGNYNEGVTVKATVEANDIDAETDEDEVDVEGASSEEGAVLTLRTDGADFQLDSTSQDTSGDDDEIGTFTLKFTATAFGDDIQIPKAGSAAIDFDILNASTDSVYATGTQSVSIVTTTGADTTDDNDDGDDAYLISDEESFTVTITLDNTGHTAAQYYAVINSISFYPNTTDALTSATVNDDFQTDPIFVGN